MFIRLSGKGGCPLPIKPAVVFLLAVLVIFSAGPAAAQEDSGGLPLQGNPGTLGGEPGSDGFSEEDAGFDSFYSEFEGEFEGSVPPIYDPLRGYNHMVTTFNDRFYFWVLKPSASVYKKVIPKPGRRGVNRFFKNLAFPIRFVNNIFQLKFKRAGVELARFTVNTTLGIAGFGDPAKSWFGLRAYPEDFGQTLGHYGAGSGFYFVIPFLGTSNFRDLLGASVDIFTDPVCYLGSCYAGYRPASWGVKSYDLFNETSLRIGEYESLKKDALDFYTFLRDTSVESRNREIAE